MTVTSLAHLDARSEAFVAEVLGELDARVPVRGAFLVGSAAAGSFDPRTSDLDLAAVVERPLGPDRRALVEWLLEVECPVRGLQLVLYVEGAQPPDFELNVNEGEERPAEDAFWFALDAAVAQEHAIPVWGERPWSDYFAPVSAEGIREAAQDSLAWSVRQAGDDEFARVNALRARHYLEHGRWISKAEAR